MGAAQIVKLLNNLLFATNLMNAAELLTVAEAQGLDTREVARVIQSASGQSYAMGLFSESASVAEIMTLVQPYAEKDVALALAAVREVGLDVVPFQRTEDYFLGGRK